ncbi:MAG TPA: hypothetical protein VMB73_22620 [Acetobacteraceae bacterium]|nr:hypothetical protein [Acetobacteraceae bacterium]
MSCLAGKHAVVVGAGIGGLAAAKSLAASFQHVTVLDRDALPREPGQRQGTPQARHAHVLLAGGQRALAALFPGVEQELEQAGAVKTRAGLDVLWERPGYDPYPRRDLGFISLSISRPLLEFIVRRRLEQEGNVTLRPGCRVRELAMSPDRGAVVGIRCDGFDRREEVLASDLVVDATGRPSLMTAMLDKVGLEQPPETEIGIDQTYATANFEFTGDPGWLGLIHLPAAPDSGRGGFVFLLEHGRWIVSVCSKHGEPHPDDIDSFMAFVRELRTPTIYNAIHNARPFGDVSRYALPASTRRHFERLAHFPRGLLAIGDSVCRFNPVFGQGMSVAAQEADALRRLLAARAALPDPLDGLAPEFFEEIQPLLAAPWSTAETDFVYPQTRGDRPADFAQRLRYGAALTQLAAEDAAVHRLVFEVNSLLRPPSVLREPELVGRVTALMAATAPP